MARRRRRRPKTSQALVPSLTERLQTECERLFKAMSIIACCRLATASLYEHGDDREVIADALQAAYDLLDLTAEALQVIGNEGKTA